ncbi:MAG: four helix bundle protein [Candidatus Binatia bacterium]
MPVRISQVLGFGCWGLGFRKGHQKAITQTEHRIPPMKSKGQVESWKDLEVWQASHGLVLKVYEATKSFPNDERLRLTDQLCRAAASIPTNIAEEKGRSVLKEYLQFLSVARGSVEEVK